MKMAKKNKTVKLFAILGLFWIIVSVVWSGILVFISQNSYEQERTFQYDRNTISQEEIQKIIDENKIEIKTWTWKNK